MTTREKRKSGKLVSASAAKTTSRTVAVGTRTVTLVAGIGETIHLKLNAAGLRALARLHKLPVRQLLLDAFGAALAGAQHVDPEISLATTNA